MCFLDKIKVGNTPRTSGDSRSNVCRWRVCVAPRHRNTKISLSPYGLTVRINPWGHKDCFYWHSPCWRLNSGAIGVSPCRIPRGIVPLGFAVGEGDCFSWQFRGCFVLGMAGELSCCRFILSVPSHDPFLCLWGSGTPTRGTNAGVNGCMCRAGRIGAMGMSMRTSAVMGILSARPNSKKPASCLSRAWAVI